MRPEELAKPFNGLNLGCAQSQKVHKNVLSASVSIAPAALLLQAENRILAARVLSQSLGLQGPV